MAPGFVVSTVIGVAALAGPAMAISDAMPQDRRAVLAPTERTTDDPRRIPARRPAGPVRHIVLRGGRVFDAVSGTVRPGSVVMEGNTIKAVLAPQVEGWPADAQVIDVAGKTVMPGLIDMHVHLTYPDPGTPIDEQASEGSGVLRGARNLRYYLESGFTSVRDMNGVSRENLDDLQRIDLVVKDGQVLVRSGQVVTPRHVPEALRKPAPPQNVR